MYLPYIYIKLEFDTNFVLEQSSERPFISTLHEIDNFHILCSRKSCKSRNLYILYRTPNSNEG